jgi:hypothetical protein
MVDRAVGRLVQEAAMQATLVPVSELLEEQTVPSG